MVIWSSITQTPTPCPISPVFLAYLSSVLHILPRRPYGIGSTRIWRSSRPSIALQMAMVARSFRMIAMMVPFISFFTYSLSCMHILLHVSASSMAWSMRPHALVISRARSNTLHTLARGTVSLMMMMMMPKTIALTCPTSCSTISPLPYPFGAYPGCGSPGFLLSNCSIPTPLWNLTLAGTPHPYYIKSINPSPIASDPNPSGAAPNYGYGGIVQLYLNPSTDVPPFCGSTSSSMAVLNNFSTSNFYAFEDQQANLTYYQDSYLFFNCSASDSSPPDSGVFTPSSPSCSKYLSYCDGPATATSCLEYVPYKELQLASFMTSYKCASFRRFVIADVDAPVSTWVSATQFAWGQTEYADSCLSCESSGGTCGYDTQDNSFQCYCGNETQKINCHQESGRGKSVAVGVSIAVIGFLALLGAAYYYGHRWYYHSMLRRKHPNLDGVNQAPLELPYGALAVATKSFSTKIGQGAFGKVYRGMLFDGKEVAVKVLDATVSHTDGQFMNEVATIGNIHHVNVARLVGFCFQKSRRILVYEYVSNGSLDNYIFPSKKGQSPRSEIILTWKQRFDIALGIARGLSYMHEDCRSCIIHCDIKPQNILLDAAFCPKISDFGLARLLKREESRVLTQARGTPGYVAPEFWSLGTGPLTAKFDVYSYGIVLLEIIRGRRRSDEYELLYQEDGAQAAWTSVAVDKRIEHDADAEQVKLCTLVAFWCVQDNPNVRPTMSKVVHYLQGTAPVPDNPPTPFTNIYKKEDQSWVSEASSSDFFASSSDRGGFGITVPRD